MRARRADPGAAFAEAALLSTNTVRALLALGMVAGILTSDQFPAKAVGNLFVDANFVSD